MEASMFSSAPKKGSQIGSFKYEAPKYESSDSEEESRVLARVDIVPGDSRFLDQPSWTKDYSLQTEKERMHSNYLAVFTPVLSPELEESLWEEVNNNKISVTKLNPPNKTEVRTRIPASKKKWYFDDSDDDLNEEEIKEKEDKLYKRDLVAKARSVGRSLLSDTWGLDDSDSDSDNDDNDDYGLSGPDRSPKLRKKRSSLVFIDDEEEETEEDKISQVKSPFSEAVDDMFDAAMNGKQSELEDIVDALSVMEVPSDEVMPASNRVVDLPDYVGNTCLMISCDLGHYQVASYLIKKARCNLEVANHLGLTALHLAAVSGHLDCVQLLVNHAGKGKQSLEGTSLFIFRGHPFKDQTAELLGEQHATPTYERELAGTTDGGGGGNNNNSKDNRKSFVGRSGSSGAEGRSKYAPCNGTALYWAATHGHLGVVKFLVGMYKPLMDESHTEENDSPLWMALYHKHRDVAKFLVENGADAVATNSAGINILGVMRIRHMEDPELLSIVKDAISKRKIRELHRRRDAEQAESRRWLAGQGEPEPGPGVVVFLVSIPDKRRSTFKRRIALDMPVRFLFEAVDIHMSDKCGLDLLHGFELHTTTKVMKRRMLEDEVLADMGFAGARITMEVFPNEPPDEREERIAAEVAASNIAKVKTPGSLAGALF